MKNIIPFRVSPMLATLVREPFHRDNWVYEEKYDGFRMLAYKEGSAVSIISRNNIERAARFPHIAAALRSLRSSTLLLDGEIVAFDPKGVSRFQLLQRGQVAHVYAIFDCLYADGKDLRREPLSARRIVMERAIGKNPLLIASRRLGANGLEAYRLAGKKGYEGLVAKDASSRYVEARSPYWLKVKVHQQDEFVIAGFTAPAGSRSHFGALLLGAYEDGTLKFVGKVGTGFDDKTLGTLYRKFVPLSRAKSPFAETPREKEVTFLAPRLVAQISYQEWTADRRLRQPVFLGLRDDKDPREVHFPEAQR